MRSRQTNLYIPDTTNTTVSLILSSYCLKPYQNKICIYTYNIVKRSCCYKNDYS